MNHGIRKIKDENMYELWTGCCYKHAKYNLEDNDVWRLHTDKEGSLVINKCKWKRLVKGNLQNPKSDSKYMTDFYNKSSIVSFPVCTFFLCERD